MPIYGYERTGIQLDIGFFVLHVMLGWNMVQVGANYMPAAFERKSLHSTFAKENKTYCADLLKDFVTSGGDWSSSELSPAIRDDPVLQQQCRTRGYMIMQIADSLRQVYCGSPTLGHSDEGASCPQCGEQFCVDHLAEHLDAKIVDP